MSKEHPCIQCEKPTKYHCAMCGCSLCEGCSRRNNGICDSCVETKDYDDDKYPMEKI